jgi:hypothetical protein
VSATGESLGRKGTTGKHGDKKRGDRGARQIRRGVLAVRVLECGGLTPL